MANRIRFYGGKKTYLLVISRASSLDVGSGTGCQTMEHANPKTKMQTVIYHLLPIVPSRFLFARGHLKYVRYKLL